MKLIVILLLLSVHAYGQDMVKSKSRYQTWDRQYHDVYIQSGTNHLIVKFHNGTTKKLIDLEAEEKRDHPCQYRDDHRAAPGRNICEYHLH